MKNNKYIWSVGALLAVVFIWGSARLISAQTTGQWQAPSQPFPNSNVKPPIDTGSSFQTKSQGIGFSTTFTGPALSFNQAQNITASGIGESFVLTPLTASGQTVLFTNTPFYLNTAGMILPRYNDSTGDGGWSGALPSGVKGMVAYDYSSNTAKLFNGNGWTDIGTGNLNPPVTLSTGSGAIGITLKLNNTSGGTNSPMIVFSSYGAPTLGYANQKNPAISLSIPVAEARIPACPPFCGIGGGGGGSNPPPADTLPQPAWWMRQEGDQFVVHASSQNLTQNVRDILTLDKWGNAIVSGDYLKEDSNGNVKPVVLSGTMCGLYTSSVVALCDGLNPGPPNRTCPAGYSHRVFGKDMGWSNDAETCMKN